VEWISNFFKKKKPAILALDLRQDSFKALVLNQTVNGPVIQNVVNEVAIERVRENDFQALTDLAQKIAQTLKGASIKIKDVALAISTSEVVTQILEIDKSQTPAQIFTLVQQHLKRHFPYAQNMSFDFHVLPGKTPLMQEVHIVACKKPKIENLNSLMTMANLNLVVVDVKTYALERAYCYLAENNLVAENRVALLEYDALNLNFQVLCKGKTEYVREHLHGESSGSKEEFSKHLARALHHYNASMQNAELEKIYCINPFPLLPEQLQTLKESVDIPLETLDPLQGMVSLERNNQREEANWMICLGLALRGCQHDHTY
jgi:Tfp pilus assembly PilM family ATPase